ncbi:MAG: hypothetical protein R3D71_08760 [Rickettsiales bacterium]
MSLLDHLLKREGDNKKENTVREDIQVMNLDGGSVCLYKHHFNSIQNKEEFSKKYNDFKEKLSGKGEIDSKTEWTVVPKDLLPKQAELLYHAVVHPDRVPDNIDRKELKGLLLDASFKSYFSGEYDTIIHEAVLSKPDGYDRSIIKEVIDKGTPDQVFRKNDDLRTPLNLDDRYQNWNKMAVANHGDELVDLLIEKGMSDQVFAATDFNSSGLVMALVGKHPDIAKKMMAKEGVVADHLAKRDSDGKTALLLAVDEGYTDIALDLVKKLKPEDLHVEWKSGDGSKAYKPLDLALEKPVEFEQVIKGIADKSTYEQLKPYENRHEYIKERLNSLRKNSDDKAGDGVGAVSSVDSSRAKGRNT